MSSSQPQAAQDQRGPSWRRRDTKQKSLRHQVPSASRAILLRLTAFHPGEFLSSNRGGVCSQMRTAILLLACIVDTTSAFGQSLTFRDDKGSDCTIVHTGSNQLTTACAFASPSMAALNTQISDLSRDVDRKISVVLKSEIARQELALSKFTEHMVSHVLLYYTLYQ